jgi:hypothetical protein
LRVRNSCGGTSRFEYTSGMQNEYLPNTYSHTNYKPVIFRSHPPSQHSTFFTANIFALTTSLSGPAPTQVTKQSSHMPSSTAVPASDSASDQHDSSNCVSRSGVRGYIRRLLYNLECSRRLFLENTQLVSGNMLIRAFPNDVSQKEVTHSSCT